VTTTQIRNKKAPKRKEKEENLRLCAEILVEYLRIGDEIVTMFKSGTYGERMALKTSKIATIEECPGQWRTHIHVNGGHCYDLRQKVWVVA
jgi:hypothetical protein